MRERALDAVVEDVRAGAPGAVEELVARFERAAIAWALPVVGGDVHQAEDAAQDAFVEALDRIGTLREPAAFGAWLRRIVVKAADRHVRRRAPRPAGTPDEVAGTFQAGTDLPDARLTTVQRITTVRAVLARASETDRAVLGLRYLLGWSYADMAETLEVPISTVKKRLHDARGRLRPRLARALDGPLPELAGPSMSRRLAFWHAISNGDRGHVAAALSVHPELAEDREVHSAVQVAGRRVALRPGFCPLHRAVAADDLGLVQLLLDQGAAPSPADDHGETPLHTAALLGRTAAVAALLRRQAVVDARTRTGMTPLHWAAIARRDDIATLLVRAGANQTAQDRNGRTPDDWNGPRARPEEDHPMTDIPLLGRTLAADGTALDEGDPVAVPDTIPELRPPGRREPLITGVRAVDVLAPLVRGGTVSLCGDQGAGHLVLVSEMAANLAADGGALIVCGRAGAAVGAAADVREAISPVEVEGAASAVMAGEHDGAGAARTAGILAATVASTGADVLLMIDGALLHTAGVEQMAGLVGEGSVTLLALCPAPDDASAPSNLDSTVMLTARVAGTGTYPAVDAVGSRSILREERSLDGAHLDAADALTNAAREGDIALSLIAQPFAVAAPWTGVPGERAGITESIERVRTALG